MLNKSSNHGYIKGNMMASNPRNKLTSSALKLVNEITHSLYARSDKVNKQLKTDKFNKSH